METDLKNRAPEYSDIPEKELQPLPPELLQELAAQEKIVSPEREQFLIREYQKSQDPRIGESLLTEYKWLISYMTNQTLASIRAKFPEDITQNIDLEDCLQEARIAFIIAARKYDSEFKTRLSTYAGKCIFGSISKWFIRKHLAQTRLPEGCI